MTRACCCCRVVRIALSLTRGYCGEISKGAPGKTAVGDVRIAGVLGGDALFDFALKTRLVWLAVLSVQPENCSHIPSYLASM